MNAELISNSKDFVEYLKRNQIENILIGNGFSLAHPNLGGCFKWDLHEALCSDWQSQLPKKSLNCPESDFNTIRENITRKILQFYIERLFEKIDPSDTQRLFSTLYAKYNKDGLSCKIILKYFESKKGSIFTLNYDPLLYFEILNYENKKNLFDGFIKISPNECLNQKYITEKLNGATGKTRVYFNHGSWFIQQNDSGDLDEISFGSGSANRVEDLYSNNKQPFIILEERWVTKKTLIDGSIYFKHCYDQLSNTQGALLAFGLSFVKDDHVLQALNQRKFNEIHISYCEAKSKQLIEEKVNKYLELKNKIKYIKVDKNVIWDRQAD